MRPKSPRIVRFLFVIFTSLLLVLQACNMPSASETAVLPQVAAAEKLRTESKIIPEMTFRGDYPTGVRVEIPVAGNNPVERAQNFLNTYQDLYMLGDADMALAVDRVTEGAGQNVVFSQTYQGLPIFGSQISVKLKDDSVASTVGVLLHGEITLDTTPAITADQAAEFARHGLGLYITTCDTSTAWSLLIGSGKSGGLRKSITLAE